MDRIKCIICDVADEEQFYHIQDHYQGNTWNMVKCKQCGLIYLNPQPDIDTLKRTYRKIYSQDNDKRLKGPLEVIEHLFRKMRANEIINFRKAGEILDIGCGRGIMLKYMKDRGWKIKGIEFSEDTGSIAKRILKEDLYIGTEAITRFRDETFDVIVIDYVLEHLSKPYEILQEVNRVLKKNGLLIVSVPNMASLQAIWSRKEWFHLDVPKHLYHFSTDTLSELLTKTKFSIVKRKGLFLEHGLFGLWQSILNILVGDNNRFYSSIISSDAENNTSFNARNIGLSLLFVLFAPVLILFSLVEKMMKRDGLIRCYAVKV